MTDHPIISPTDTQVETMKGAEVAHGFLTALAARDFQRLETRLHPGIRFRALVPPGLRTGTGPKETVGWLKKWFGGADHFEVIQSETDYVSDHLHIAYRIRLHNLDGWQVVEQQIYCTVKDQCIEVMDVLCAGFRPEVSLATES